MAGFVDRVAEQAATIKPLKVLLTLLAVPFYVLGWVVGLVVVVVMFAVGAVKVGIVDARQLANRRPATVDPGGDG